MTADQVRLTSGGTSADPSVLVGTGTGLYFPTATTIGSAGNLVPATTYTYGLGTNALKWLTLDVAELHVGALIAEEKIATIGGRIVVAPTTVLAANIDNSTTTITTKHNLLIIGDRIVMESVGQVEWMAVTAGPTGTGPYLVHGHAQPGRDRGQLVDRRGRHRLDRNNRLRVDGPVR